MKLSQLGKNSSSNRSDSGSNALESASNLPKLTKIRFKSVKLDRRGTVIDNPEGSAEIFTEDLGNDIKLTMVKIPAGKFLMGSPESEKERDTLESPQHQVSVPEFYLGRILVTQAQWTALMGSNPSYFKGDDELPVEKVSWLDAMDFCQKLSQKTGRIYRLPSSSEWEYACRAGATSPFAFGETITSSVVNYNGKPYKEAPKGKYRGRTTPGGNFFPPNLFGLYDMHGNVWEWCLDEWGGTYDEPTDGSARGDVNSRDGDKLRVRRGGCWDLPAPFCRSAEVYPFSASHSSLDCGFRVVSLPSKIS